MDIHKQVPTKYLIFGIILCVCVGIIVAYFFYPKLDPITLPDQTIEYKIPSQRNTNLVEQQVPDYIKDKFNSEKEDQLSCIQVITAAKNQITGETKDFPTPCDVPEGWIVIEKSKQ